MRSALLFVLIAALCSTVGNMLLKASSMHVSAGSPFYAKLLSPFFVGAVLFYVINLGFFSRALDQMPVSVGYPILAASGFAMLAVAAALFYGENFGRWQVGGLAMVVLGIFALAQGK